MVHFQGIHGYLDQVQGRNDRQHHFEYLHLLVR